MSDNNITIEQLKLIFEEFINQRGWDKLGSAKDLSMDIVSEATELMNIFIFVEEDKLNKKLAEYRNEVENEIADIAFALFNFCLRYKIDLTKAIERKMILNQQKHPISENANG